MSLSCVVAQVPQVRVVMKTVETPQLQSVVQAPGVQVVAETAEIPQLLLDVQVAQLQVVKKIGVIPETVEISQLQLVAETVESPQLEIVKKTIEIPEIRTVRGTQTSESLSSVDSKGLNYQDCEVLFHVNKQSPDTAVHVDRDDLRDEIDDHSIMFGHVVSAGRVHVGKDDPDDGTEAQQAQKQQQHKHSNQLQSTRQAMQQRAGEREKEREQQGEKGRKGERGKKEKGRDAEEEECKQVEKDATGWTVVTRGKKQKKRMIQIFVKVDEAKVNPIEVSLTDGKGRGRVRDTAWESSEGMKS